MNKIAGFFKSHKYAIMWTIAYVTIMWAILQFMFNFNIFNGHQWQLLARTELQGFAGFVLGILVLAALPMYIATTAVIMRTKKPLITVNITPIIKIFNAIIPHPVPAHVPVDTQPQIAAPEQTSETPGPATPSDGFPATLPSELRGAFTRARQHINNFSTSAFNPPMAGTIDTAPIGDTQPDATDLPLPPDFDFDPDSDSGFDEFAPMTSMPTFTDINFDSDDDDDDDDDDIPVTESPDAFVTDTNFAGDNDIIDYLAQRGITPVPYENMIIANDIIIMTHSEPEFWIADPENWFAAGKQKPSPVVQLIKASAKTGKKPIFYLAQTNIMDMDTCRATWTKMGITSITDISELPL